MLVEFKVGNYLSFKNEITFSMVASNIKEHKEYNVISDINENLNLLKSAVIYGANASGKSNLFKAMGFMKDFIFNSSANRPEGLPIPVERFKLSSETENKPSFFEITFIHENIRYRYGFEVDKVNVHSEWLYSAPGNRERKLFVREGQILTVGRYFSGGNKFKKITRKDTLFLSVAAQFNHETAGKILAWFNKFNIRLNIDEDYINIATTTKMMMQENLKVKILDFLNKADINIKDILIKKTFEETMQYIGIEFITLETVHNKYNENNELSGTVIFDFKRAESAGTQKFYNLSGPVLDTLEKGHILIIDELDLRLHPLLSQSIVKIFNSPHNRQNAQLIFASHDTCLLNKDIFRRDQIWFTEKDRYEVTDLYSLLEYKVRNDASFGKDYILGKYGAIPFIGNYSFLSEET